MPSISPILALLASCSPRLCEPERRRGRGRERRDDGRDHGRQPVEGEAPVDRQLLDLCDGELGESLTRARTPATRDEHERIDWTYWHWFESGRERIGGRRDLDGRELLDIGEIINRYGVMSEGSFIASEASDEMSMRQKSALAAMNASLRVARSRRRRTVEPRARQERARRRMALTPSVVSQLNRVFGPAVTRTLDKSTGRRRSRT